jgi:hypothetical protein
MTHLFEDMDLAGDSLHIGYIADLAFLQHLDSYLLPRH